MEQENQNSTPQTPVTNETREGGSLPYQLTRGLVIGMIIASTILIAALYMGSISMPQPEVADTVPQATDTETVFYQEPDASTETLRTQSASDELVDIEADLNATDWSSLEDIEAL